MILFQSIKMNKCRLCFKKIWDHYSDKILFCSRCRKEVEESIWYKTLKMSREEKDEICYSLARENTMLKKYIDYLKWLQICWKTVAQWIEEDKKVVRE